MRRRHPHAQCTAPFGESVAEDERPLIGKPQRPLVPTARVPERAKAARKLLIWLDRLHRALRRTLLGIPHRWPESSRAVALDDRVDAPRPTIGRDLAQMIW